MAYCGAMEIRGYYLKIWNFKFVYYWKQPKLDYFFMHQYDQVLPFFFQISFSPTGSLISDWFFLDTYKWGKNNPFKWCHGFFWTLRHVSLMQSFWFYEIRLLNTRPVVWSAIWIRYISRAFDFAVVAKNSLKSMLNLNWT